MNLIDAVSARGGVARAAKACDAAGVTRHAVDRAVREGAVFRPSQGWIALPDADPMLVSAARSGVIISCVTRAARLGLWDVGETCVHVAARPNAALRRPTSAVVHWANPVAPRDPEKLEDSVENTLALVAECRPYEEALAIWESALNRNLIAMEHLVTVPFRRKGRRLVGDVEPWSDSGLESVVVPRLRWLKLPLRRQSWLLGHRVDLLIADRLVLQIDGGHHVDAQRRSDIEHDASLRLAGFHVIRISYAQIMTDWPRTQELILGAITRGLHLAAPPH